MTAAAIGAVIAGAVKRIDARPTGSKLRRHSRPAGEGPFVMLTWPQANERMQAIVKWERKQKRKDRCKNRAVGHIGIEVFRFLARRAVNQRGRLDDLSYEAIAAILGFARSAVVAACARLKRFGWLTWRRQYVSTGQPGLRGIQVEQTYNAFQILAPIGDLLKLGLRFGPPPPPDDHDHAAKAGQAANKAADIADSPLGRALEKLGRGVAERETSKRSDSMDIQIQDASSSARPVNS